MRHSNQAILDEAARSIRRAFIGSMAGGLGMLAVVGAAGAYGMPERFTAQALAAALAQFNTTFPHAAALAHPPGGRAVRAATQSVTGDPPPIVASPAGRKPVVMTIAEEPPAARAMPAAEPVAPAAIGDAPLDVAAASPTALSEGAGASANDSTAPPPPALVTPAPELAAAPAVTASLAPRQSAPLADSVIPAPLVFEQPKLADIKPLEAMPKLEPAATDPEPPVDSAAVPPGPQSPPQPSAIASAELPITAWLPMPPQKPPLTPAQRLDLQGKDYDKAERCLAQAIYFEARNEPPRGQMAVAQVVLNRVFSPYYPKDICSVVYQNAHHYLGCQFTFACDGKPEAIREAGAWLRANRIAKQALEAKIWLPEVAKATHYHAAYVRPAWVREMRVMARYGLHTFYRPRNWGDGSNEPAWGAGAKKLVKS